MSAATLIAAKDFRLRIRDRSAIILGIIAPLALAFIVNLVFGNVFEAGTLDLSYGMVDLDESDISQNFGEVLKEVEAEGILTLTEYANASSADAAIEEGSIHAYYLIEPGFGDGVVGQEDTDIKVVGDVDAATSTQIAASIAEQFGQGITTVQLAIGSTVQLSDSAPTPEQIGMWVQQAAQQGQSFAIEDVSADTKQLDQTTYFAASMG
ncbi:MAG: ABC transporter permease, partial [Acidimicrobiia bacterium]